MENNNVSIEKFYELLSDLCEKLKIEIDELKERLKENENIKGKKMVLETIMSVLDSDDIEKFRNEKQNIGIGIDLVFGSTTIWGDLFNIICANIDNQFIVPNVYSLLDKLKNKISKKVRGFEYQISKVDEDDIKDKLGIYKDFIFSIKYRRPIKPYQYAAIKKYLESKKYDSIEIIKICTYIEGFNNCIYKKSRYGNVSDILSVFNTGYEEFPTIDLGKIRNYKVNLFVESLYDVCCDSSDDFPNFLSCLPRYDDKIYSEQEYKKIYFDFMKYIQNKIINDIIACLKDIEFYFNKEFRSNLLKEYDKWLKIYLECRSFFEEQLLNINDVNEYLMETDENSQKIVKHRFLFSMSKSGSFFENDLKEIPYEYYERIIDLLEKKRYGYLGPNNDKQLVNNSLFKGYRELKDDQVRIIYKKLDDNIIIVYGVAVKKSDNDIHMYERLVSRPHANLEDGKYDDTATYDEIIKYLNNNKRKGNR